MRPRALLLVVLVVLAVPASAAAKGVGRAVVCGTNGCASVQDEETRFALLGGGRPIDPPRPGPFYRLRIELVEGETTRTFRQVYLPSAGAVRGEGENGEPAWTKVDAPVRRTLDRAVGGRTAYPASRIGAMGATKRTTVAPVVAAPGDDGFPWWLVAAAGVGALGVAIAALAWRRRRGQWPVLFRDA
jgi:hypothetical protein